MKGIEINITGIDQKAVDNWRKRVLAAFPELSKAYDTSQVGGGRYRVTMSVASELERREAV